MRAADITGRRSRIRSPRSTSATGWRDVIAGLAGAGVMAAAVATPFLRRRREAWGVGTAAAGRRFPGDDLVPVRAGPGRTASISEHRPAQPGRGSRRSARTGPASTATSGLRTLLAVASATPAPFTRSGHTRPAVSSGCTRRRHRCVSCPSTTAARCWRTCRRPAVSPAVPALVPTSQPAGWPPAGCSSWSHSVPPAAASSAATAALPQPTWRAGCSSVPA